MGGELLRVGINALFLVAGEGGGLERYLRNLIKALQKIDHTHEYIIFTNRDNTRTFNLGNGNNFTEYYSPVSARFRIAKICWEQMVLPSLVKKNNIDILLSPGNIHPLFVSCPSIAIMHDIIPFVWSVNYSKIELYSLKILFYFTAKTATKIITDSKSSQKQIRNRFNISPDKITAIYLGCDEKFLSYQSSLRDKKRVKEKLGITKDFILCTAPTRPYKNIGRLLSAFHLLKRKYKIKECLVIAGLPGRDYKYLLTKVKGLRLEEEVMFTGFVSDDDLPALYSAASIFVYPSLYEGFGLPLLEAMACGTPVVVSNSTSLPEVVGNAGVLFNPTCQEEMACGIYNILINKQYQDQLIDKGKQRVKQFTWEKTASEIRKVLNLT